MLTHVEPTVAARPLQKASPKPFPRVRLATPQDLESCLEMGRELHAENGLMDLDEDQIREAAIGAIFHNRDTIAVIGKPGRLEAMAYLGIRQFWYAKKTHLEEMLNFVREPFRRSQNAKALLRFEKESSLALGMPLLIGIISSHRTEAKMRLYRRELGAPSGGYWVFNGTTGRTGA